MAYRSHEVPSEVLGKWQDTANVMADIFEVPAALIMRVHAEQIEVLVAAHRQHNPYEPQETARLGTGLYCETVMARRELLQVPNALEDPAWSHNPDVALNMIAYLGVPLLWPDQSVFGTICVLDSKTRQFEARYIELLWELKRTVESDFALIDHQLQLEARNQELALALQHLSQSQARLLELQKNAALGTLVAGLAHELNTPIGNGLMVASTLQDHVREFAARPTQAISAQSLRAFLGTLGGCSEVLMSSLGKAAELVQDFKQLAIAPESLRRHRFPLAALVKEALTGRGQALREAGCSLCLDIPPGLMMDSAAAALGQALNRLLDNSLKHAFGGAAGPQEPSLEIRARVLPGDEVLIEISDNGRGIRPDLHERIFDPFVTGQLGRSGSGLGLHLVHKLVHTALGGEIELHSQLGQGTRVLLRLPLQGPGMPAELH